jgi:hypothetical protein
MTPKEYQQLQQTLSTRLPGGRVLDRRPEPEPEPERTRARNLTDAEMARWRQHFETLITNEGIFRDAAITGAIEAEHALMVEYMEIVGKVFDAMEAAQERAVAGLRKDLDAARKEINTLRQVVAKLAASDKGAITDLPNPLPARPAKSSPHVAGHA